MAQDHHKPRLSAFVLAYNEEINLGDCLESLQGCVDDVYLVDSGSEDRTAEIAETHGCTVVVHPFEGHSRQRNWALRNLPFRHPWVLALDADHRLTPELAKEVREKFLDPPDDVVGFFVKRRQVFRRKWIRHGGYYPKWQLKVFQHENARCDDDEFDYRFYVDGATGRLRHDIIEENAKERDISFWIQKHDAFARESAAEEYQRRTGQLGWGTTPKLFGNPDQRVLWLKSRWYRLPLYVRPFLYFFYRFFLKLGFLDGKQGTIFHFLQAFWFRLLVDIHLDEMLNDSPLDLADASGSRAPR